MKRLSWSDLGIVLCWNAYFKMSWSKNTVVCQHSAHCWLKSLHVWVTNFSKFKMSFFLTAKPEYERERNNQKNNASERIRQSSLREQCASTEINLRVETLFFPKMTGFYCPSPSSPPPPHHLGKKLQIVPKNIALEGGYCQVAYT